MADWWHSFSVMMALAVLLMSQPRSSLASDDYELFAEGSVMFARLDKLYKYNKSMKVAEGNKTSMPASNGTAFLCDAEGIHTFKDNKWEKHEGYRLDQNEYHMYTLYLSMEPFINGFFSILSSEWEIMDPYLNVKTAQSMRLKEQDARDKCLTKTSKLPWYIRADLKAEEEIGLDKCFSPNVEEAKLELAFKYPQVHPIAGTSRVPLKKVEGVLFIIDLDYTLVNDAVFQFLFTYAKTMYDYGIKDIKNLNREALKKLKAIPEEVYSLFDKLVPNEEGSILILTLSGTTSADIKTKTLTHDRENITVISLKDKAEHLGSLGVKSGYVVDTLKTLHGADYTMPEHLVLIGDSYHDTGEIARAVVANFERINVISYNLISVPHKKVDTIPGEVNGKIEESYSTYQANACFASINKLEPHLNENTKTYIPYASVSIEEKKGQSVWELKFEKSIKEEDDEKVEFIKRTLPEMLNAK